MAFVSREKWNDIGMAISFLGREICRPTNPNCEQCVMNQDCSHHTGVTNETSV